MRLNLLHRVLFLLALVPSIAIAQQNLRVVPYGTSCSSATIGWRGMPDTGDTFNVTLAGAPANSLVGLFVGFSDRKWASAGLPLPQKLSALGARNCALWASPDLTFTAVTDNAGNASFPIQIPNSAAYNGVRLYAQAFIPQPGVNPLGITFTRALRIVIRQPVVMRDTIGASPSYTDGKYGTPNFNTLSQGILLVTPSIVSPLTAPAVLKSVRLVGFPVNHANFSCLGWNLRVWDSQSSALATPATGNVANVTNAVPSVGPQPFGTAPTGWGGSPTGLSYEVGFDVLQNNIVLQTGTPYAMTAVSVSLCGTNEFHNSESAMIPGPSDWCSDGVSSAPNLQCAGFGIPVSTGVNAIQVVASPLQ